MRVKTDASRPRPVTPGEGSSLQDWLEYLESIHPREIDLGLDRVLTVLRRLFPRNPKARIITIAGTNGKGSAVACLEKLLLTAGRSTGAYSSPHLQRYNERVRVNGHDVSDACLITAFERVEKARGTISLTYFEFGTLAAFDVFAETGVEDWVLEVGLGGRLDAVNVLDPDLAIITSVDIDHISLLGDNRETIGFEKAGILRPGITAIYADLDPPRSVLQQASAQGVRLLRPGHGYQLEPVAGQVTLSLPGDAGELPLATGALPVTSVAAAAVAASLLVPELSLADVGRALGDVRLSGRYEQVRHIPDVYIDVGHNPHAARWLADRLAQGRRPGGRIIAVYAALADKDIEGVAAALAPVVDQWYLAGLKCHRGLSVEALALRFSAALPDVRAEELSSVPEAVDQALLRIGEADTLIIFGSFYTVAAAREHLLPGESAVS